jgi:hypothetical protein
MGSEKQRGFYSVSEFSCFSASTHLGKIQPICSLPSGSFEGREIEHNHTI